ncbi:Protein of unknown function DUF2855 [Penicillium cosmopolitanum]|uniref:Uncharacterized protein n=1 Tax=Penicillium cosmopolitanum TaxID=1131564 RepID=A0A9W9W6G0_9EURO|nr:Protein of unknown function DUF2855 [Penicillium cosmopolitanum]KAJ5404328.1 Protein of unknown function DUF2855 [Penicillium cosmopolitanum]
MAVHVVSKLDISQHATFPVPAAAGPQQLAPSSLRVKTQLITLSSNNLTYAKLGSALGWWNTYPVSPSYPAPYNDESKWGIVPAWGFASIEESNIPELTPGTLLHGYWPTSAALTDLKLQATTLSGHWLEISDHRSQLMPLYNRYNVQPTSLSAGAIANSTVAQSTELDKLGWSAVFQAIWQAGYYLSEYVFSPREGIQPIHPLGNAAGLTWTDDDADLSKSVVVSLAPSGKTGRSFAYFFERKSKELAPLGFLQVTSAVEGLSRATESAAPSFPSKAIAYSDISDPASIEWIRNLGPSKIILLDFGAREGTFDELLAGIKQNKLLASSKVVLVQIGGPQKKMTAEEMAALMAKRAQQDIGRVQYNTSGVIDSALVARGAEVLYEELAQEWEKLLSKRHLTFPDLEIIWKDGVNGADGIEGGWDLLNNGKVGASEALVYRVQGAQT